MTQLPSTLNIRKKNVDMVRAAKRFVSKLLVRRTLKYKTYVNASMRVGGVLNMATCRRTNQPQRLFQVVMPKIGYTN